MGAKIKIVKKVARKKTPVPAARVHSSKKKYTRKVKHKKPES